MFHSNLLCNGSVKLCYQAFYNFRYFNCSQYIGTIHMFGKWISHYQIRCIFQILIKNIQILWVHIVFRLSRLQLKCISLNIVARKPSDIDDDDSKAFHPEFTHQLFGDKYVNYFLIGISFRSEDNLMLISFGSESIFGYRDLKIMLYYSAARLTTFLNMTYKEKVNPDLCDGVKADEILGVISEKLQPGFHTNIDNFRSSLLKDETFKPHGELIHSFNHPLSKSRQQVLLFLMIIQ